MNFNPVCKKKNKCKKSKVEYIVGPRGPAGSDGSSGTIGPTGPAGSANIVTTLISDELANIDSNSNLPLDSSTNNINTVIKNTDVDKTNNFIYFPLANGLNSNCNTIAFDPSGNLYAGGDFSQAQNTGGNVQVNNIAKWDGSEWSALANGLDSDCNTIAFDPDAHLYAGGYFNQAGGNTVNRIVTYSNDYVNLLVNNNTVDTLFFRQTTIILISGGIGYKLNFN
jgi:hypothetical protein